MNEALKSAVRHLMELIASGDYEAAHGQCHSARLSVADLRHAIHRYGRTITNPPSSCYSDLDAVAVNGTPLPTWSVFMPFWTAEEGQSDLVIELTVALDGSRALIELDDVRVP
jgi:hypothetical protein